MQVLGHCEKLCDHFNNDGYKVAKYRVKITEKLPRNRQTRHKAMNASITEIRKENERVDKKTSQNKHKTKLHKVT